MSKLYADTDFLLARIIEDDWLQSSAREEKNFGDMVTSAAAILEVVMVMRRSGLEDSPALIKDVITRSGHSAENSLK